MMNRTTSRRRALVRRTLRLAAIPAVVGIGCVQSAEEQRIKVVWPGQDIQAIAAGSPEGTIFHFQPGIYRQQTIYPKNRQELIGQDGVILSGAMELTSWRKQDGLWVTQDELPPPLPSDGDVCAPDRDLCHFREDLFFNGRLYERVGSFDSVGPGKWYYDRRRAYLADDPTGQSVELGVTPLAIGSDAEAVVVRDLIVEKYASLAQDAAIEFFRGRGWLVSGVTARWNHGGGLGFGPEARVEGGSFSHNGQIGMKGTGEDSTVEGVEIAFNNYAGYDPGWEGGGTKFYRVTRLVVRDSCIHHNKGQGVWTDIDNVDVLYEGNIVFMNANDGIKHEISYDAVIRDNISAFNGYDDDTWLWGTQILIQNSRNVEVYDNLVVVTGWGNGIGVVHQDRSDGPYGPWNAVNNHVHDNTIVHLGRHGTNGVVTDTKDGWFWSEGNNVFDRNTYIVADEEFRYWSFDWAETWDDVKRRGQEQNGERIVEQRGPMSLSCEGLN
jgi:hypothetical protein